MTAAQRIAAGALVVEASVLPVLFLVTVSARLAVTSLMHVIGAMTAVTGTRRLVLAVHRLMTVTAGQFTMAQAQRKLGLAVMIEFVFLP